MSENKEFDLKGFEHENRSSSIIDSAVPARCKTEPCCLGIDEAGRGPVLGPMVYGISYSPLSCGEELKQLGFADSKTLTEEKREELFSKLNEKASDYIGWMVHILAPNHISNAMLRRSKYNLNAMSHDTAIGLIQRSLDQGVDLSEVYVDTVGPPEKYQDKLQKLFPQLKITVSKKADAIYPIVSAASICAKDKLTGQVTCPTGQITIVARDHAVKRWKFIEGEHLGEAGYGSGYPADPGTKSFMKESFDTVFGYPQFVRFSWSTASKVIEEDGVPVFWEDDEDDDEDHPRDDLKQVPAITSFFQAKAAKPPSRPHPFFSDRNLTSLSNL